MLAGISWLYWLLAFVISAAITIYYYRWLFPFLWGNKGDKSVLKPANSNRVWWFLAVTLRWLGLFLIGLFLLNPWWVLRSSKEVKPLFLVYLDSSLSVGGNDLTAAKNWLASQFQLSDGVVVNVHSFGTDVQYPGKLASVTSGELDTLWKAGTNIEAVFKDVEQNKHNAPIAGVLVVTDGIVNEGLDPNYLVNKSEIPHFFIGLGDATQYPDVAIKSVLVNDEVLSSGVTPVEVQLVSQAYIGNVTAELIINGKVVSNKIIALSQQKESQKIGFDWTNKVPGNYQVGVRVLPLKEEKNSFNNEVVKLVRVVDDTKRILLISDIVDPDIGAIRKSLKNWEQFSVQIANHDAIGSADENADIIIVKGLKSELPSRILKKWQDQGKPVWLIISSNEDMVSFARLMGLRNSSVVWQDVQVAWNEQYSGFSLDSRLAKSFSNHPPLQVPMISTESLQIGSEDVLFWQKWGGSVTQMPLHWVMRSGTLKQVMVSLGTGFWKWRLNEFQELDNFEGFDQWMRRSVMVLNSMVDKPQRIEIQVSDHIADETKPVLGRVVYRDGDGKINNDVKVSLTVEKLQDGLVTKKGEISQIVVNRGEVGMDFRFQNYTAGRYKLIASTNVGGRIFEDQEMILVNQVPNELMEQTAKHQWMNNLASASKGEFTTINNLSNFNEKIKKKIQTNSVLQVEETQTYWWRILPLLLVLALCFGGEWALRKWLGEY